MISIASVNILICIYSIYQIVNFIYSLDLEKRLSSNFEEVLKLIQEDAFWNNVGEGIEKTYPGIKELLKERMKDLEKRDCEIVVAGMAFGGISI